MADIQKYPTKDFSAQQTFLAYDPSQGTVRVSGQDIVDSIDLGTPIQLLQAEVNERVQYFRTTDLALLADLPISRVIYTTGASAENDGLGAHFVVVAAGTPNSLPMTNGNALLQLEFISQPVTYINSVADIAGFAGAVNDQQISLKGWHPDSDVGGGILYWDADKPKADHNGGTVFSPTVPFGTVADYLDGVGETDPAGIGCWVRLLDGFVTPEMFGAVGDGASNSNISVNDAFEKTATSNGPYVVDTFNYKTNMSIDRVGITDNGNNGNVASRIGANTENLLVSGSSITSIDGIALNDQSSGSSRIFFNNNSILGASYGVLFDDASGGNDVKNVIFSNNYIYSNRADAVELNHFEGLAANFIFNSNIIETGDGSSFAGSGFGFGLAGTKSWILSSAIIPHSRKEAIHIEDEQEGGQITSVTALDCFDHGLNNIRSAGDQPNSGPLNATNLTFRHTGAKAGYRGVFHNAGGNGATPMCNYSNIIVEGFDRGFDIGGGARGNITNVSNLSAIDCSIAANITAAAKVNGGVSSSNCGVLVQINNNCSIDGLFSDTQPSAIAVFTGGATSPGATIRRLRLPIAVSHTGGGGTESTDLFDLPDRMSGRITVRLDRNNAFFFNSFEFIWNGSALTINSSLPSHIGGLSGSTLVNNSGVLAIQFASSAAINDYLYIEFDGIMYIRDDINVYGA